MALLDASMFSPWLNQTFCIQADEGTLETALIEVTEKDYRYGMPEAKRKPFCLVFRGPKEKGLEQGTYKVEHAKAGSFDIFLVPIGPDEKGLCYEAVFN